ncbi:hypothetical protein CALVIDRAFT_456784, partial [Calocera viscosa TUFC12733]
FASDLLVLHNPCGDLWHMKAGRVLQQPLSWRKVLFALELSNNFRGIGWNFELRSLQSSIPQSRVRFLMQQVVRGMSAWMLVDITQTIFRHRTACHIDGSIFKDGPAWQSVYVLAGWTNVAGGLVVPHVIAAAITVGLGLYRPEDWPSLFRLREGYTVRRFWGRAWHHLFRRFLTSNSQFVSRHVLGLQKGNPLLPYVELYLAFFLSGIVHWVGTYAMLRQYTAPNMTLLFFLLQATVIALEDFVVAFGKRMGIKDSWWVRLLGYVWVAVWMVVLTPVRTEPLIKAGY